jgi:hypothetical protein
MIKHIEGTKAGDRVTRNTPVGSVVTLPDHPWECVVVYVNGIIILAVHKDAFVWIVTKNYFSCVNFVKAPGPLPWHHRAWNWLAERWGK